MDLRYQNGHVRSRKRKYGSVCWEFRWRDRDRSGKPVRRTSVIGTIEEYPTNVKVVQELMRHAGSRFTLEVYTQAKEKGKREAQQRIVEMMLPDEGWRFDCNGKSHLKCWVPLLSNEDEQRGLNGVLWCLGKCGELV